MPQTRSSARASLDGNAQSTPSKADRRLSDAGRPPAKTRTAAPLNWGGRNALQIALFGVCVGACSGWALSVPPGTDFVGAFGRGRVGVSGLQILQSFSQRFESTRAEVSSEAEST